ncbi:MAG: DUF1624 domain-containing protein [Clostridia bacterium]|nr:DUF1624 domain-containing protein [Clostridia bacterium]
MKIMVQTGVKQPGRPGRVPEIELMKAVAIISMVLVHVFEMSSGIMLSSRNENIAGYMIELFGGVLSAGVFMFAMGWGAAYSKRTMPQTYLKRAFSLFILGIVINLFEEYLPAILVPDTYGPLPEILPSILATDIYFFSSLMSLYFALMKMLERKRGMTAAVSILTLAVCVYLNITIGVEAFTTGSKWLDTILGLFIRVNEYSYFPFISWFVFPIMGYWLARGYQKVSLRRALIFAFITGIEALFFAEWFIRSNRMMDATIFNVVEIEEEFYYALHPLYALAGYGIIAVEFLLVHFILKLSHGQLHPTLTTMSRNVSPIYVVQWLTIGLLSPVLANLTDIWPNILLALFVLFVSYFGGNLLKKTNLINV